MKLAKLNNGPEIFNTIQGEGVSAGAPATFIRASRCNLHCRWCDTDYTWNFEGTPWKHDFDANPGYRKHRKEEVTIEISSEEIAAVVRKYPTRRVILTGGEPLLQQSEWLEVINDLRSEGETWTIEVETNGTKLPDEAFAQAIDQFNVSPKLSNSGMDAKLRIIPAALEYYAKNPKTWFKFVITGPEDLTEVDALAATFRLPADRMLLMPEGRTPNDLNRNAPAVVSACIERGWRFSDRLHVRLWGDKRGV